MQPYLWPKGHTSLSERARQSHLQSSYSPVVRAQLVERPEFHRGAVTGDEAEPAVVEVVTDRVAEAFGERLGEEQRVDHLVGRDPAYGFNCHKRGKFWYNSGSYLKKSRGDWQ